MYESLILVVPAKQTKRCIRTSSLVSTAHRRSFWEVTTVSASTCGVSDVFSPSSSPVTPFSPVRTNKSNSHVSWRSSVRPPETSSRKPREGSYSSTRHSSLVSLFLVRAEGEDQAANPSAVPSNATTRLSWTFSHSVFVGIRRSVCDLTKLCRIPSLPTSHLDGRDPSARALETRLRPIHQPPPPHHNLRSNVLNRQTRFRPLHRKHQRRCPVHAHCPIPPTQPLATLLPHPI